MASDREIFDRLIPKGKAIFDDLIQRVRLNGNTFNQLPSLHPLYSVYQAPRDCIAANDKFTERLVAFDQSFAQDWVFHSVSAPQSLGQHSAYDNAIHASGRSIVCLNNNSANDTLRSTSQLYWSDHMAIAYHSVVTSVTNDAGQHFGGSTKSLETVWRHLIANTDTLAVIRVVTNLHPNEGLIFDVANTTDSFRALLGTDNGKGIARMLASYPQLFGRKIISHVRVNKRVSNELCWFLETVKESPPKEINETPSKKARRQARKSLGSAG